MSGLYEARALVPSAARTATANGDPIDDLFQLGGHHGRVEAVAFVLDVTAAATAVDDTLDVYIQSKLDGTNWVDVQRFTQILGNGGAKRYFAKIIRDAALTEFENGAALGAAAKRDLVGAQWRARWVVTDAGAANASFTFSVVAVPM